MDKPKGAKKQYLFSVDILVEGYSNGIALETLLHVLNSDKIKDYKVLKGIDLGTAIDSALAASAGNVKKIAIHESAAQSPKFAVEKKQQDPKAPPATAKENQNLAELFNKYRTNNTLIRLTILKGKGVKLSIPCRIVNLDNETGMLTVYHVDEKIVYQFSLTEVDDFTVGT
ncbi:hypothetical protein [Gorillibacterium massiliense]|uniref:hypothetical protein n=1 Tax=Gorillibacterium massiliense TaxID=1280390 RepID=UPI0004B91E5B|nr:hypothetical protein [Gorillibacterium massiliense]